MSETEYDPSPGDIVELNSGGPPMVIVEITVPGKNVDAVHTSDVVAWWRDADDKPQILEVDSRCVRLLNRGHGWRPAGARQ